MSKTKRPVKPIKKSTPLIPVILIGLALVVLLTVGGFTFAASQETHDAFCASCHTQPESTFFQHATASQAVDLASFHTPKTTACIDCHSGVGLGGRLQAELLGAMNAFKWYTGTAVQPAVLIYPISDQNCLKCHADVMQQRFTPKESITVPGVNTSGRGEGRNNHWHQFMTRWQAATASAGTCTSCHSGHASGGSAQSGFMTQQPVVATCNACHQVLRRD